jgi:hypothetical protein
MVARAVSAAAGDENVHATPSSLNSIGQFPGFARRDLRLGG